MSVPELAGYVLESIVSQHNADRGVLNVRNFCNYQAREYAPPQGFDRVVGVRCAEAFAWLVTHGMLCQDFEQDPGWHVVTELGASLDQRATFNAYVAASELPETFVHPAIAQHARPLFLQGRHETAVFEAFKSLEVAIRNAARFGNDVLGKAAAQKAFHPEHGPLTDKFSEQGERVALMELMAGALGSFKNPSSHRRVDLTAAESRELLVFASHLLRIVEDRETQLRARPAPSAAP